MGWGEPHTPVRQQAMLPATTYDRHGTARYGAGCDYAESLREQIDCLWNEVGVKAPDWMEAIESATTIGEAWLDMADRWAQEAMAVTDG